MTFSVVALLFAAGAAQPVTEVRDSYPSLSPDGATLLFQSNRPGRNAIYLADADGSNVRVLFDAEEAETPAWSPDGKKIAFVAVLKEDTEIFVMDADGSNVAQITDQPGDDAHPHWSNDGRIFFNSARTTPDLSADWSAQYHEIFSMKADGSDVKQHTQCRSVCTYGAPAPDGKRLAFRKVINGDGLDWAQEKGARNSEIFVARLDGSAERNLSDSPAFDGWPSWSPDSRYVIFASNRGGVPFVGQIYAVSPEGGAVFALTDEAWSNVQPSLAADGRSLFTYRNLEWESGEFGHAARAEIVLP
ncbi:MAG: PD40 domain-containing protein [Parvularculaceae bacterium]|nr:PD40 domain-containing protein [Parvularculaceae bacterium]